MLWSTHIYCNIFGKVSEFEKKKPASLDTGKFPGCCGTWPDSETVFIFKWLLFQYLKVITETWNNLVNRMDRTRGKERVLQFAIKDRIHGLLYEAHISSRSRSHKIGSITRAILSTVSV